MKRDMEIIRAILFKLESEENIKPTIDGFPSDQIRYNMALVIEEKLAEGIISNGVSNLSQAPSDVFVRRLTGKGHDFLDSLRKESVWNTIKREFKNESLKTIVSVSKRLTEAAVKKKVDELLEEKP